MCGMVEKAEEAKLKSPYAPFFAIVSPPADYRTISGGSVKAEEVDLVSRLLFMLKMHKTYPVTGTVCTGAAVRIPGCIAYEVLREAARSRLTVNIGHPGGVIPVEAAAETTDGQMKMKKIGVYRTARRIMDGTVYVRKTVFK
jgi:2-methylaconitate cis-trans-isomerase PrpF